MNDELVLFFDEDFQANPEDPMMAVRALWEGGKLEIETNGVVLMDDADSYKLLAFLKERLEPELENE